MKKKVKVSRFDRILQDIKDVKIQGATNVAKAGVKAFFLKPKKMPEKKTVKKILKTRPTEPLLKNAISFILKSKNKKSASEKVLKHLKKSQSKISKSGKNLIKNEMNIYVHCHSSTVIGILKYAKKRKKRFVVYTTEVEPLLQGRQTARDLAKAKIKTILVPDLAAEQSLKKCDLLLFGADAYLKKGVVNKIGTSTLCKLAQNHKIPRYSCGISLKFTKKVKIEQRKSKEVWQDNNKLINVQNPAFDLTKPKLISGVVSEFGILSYKQFIKKAKLTLKKFS